ncbi:hypothetical protein [Nocardia sp. SYP-A9097]|uniref:hypothetical protein n=1 Tax=Nocardia sp. SYP-A9097 TaxID=2663237 RepID=UPI00129B23A2|nr:hypothetical protein [Nocardia sp. SYP-A9097]
MATSIDAGTRSRRVDLVDTEPDYRLAVGVVEARARRGARQDSVQGCIDGPLSLGEVRIR